MKIVILVQRRTLTYSISSAFDSWHNNYNYVLNEILPPLQFVNKRQAIINTLPKLCCCFSTSAKTYGTFKQFHVNKSVSLGFQKRLYNNDRRKEKKLQLMDFPEIVWPSPMKTIRNWILARLIITPYFDREFYIADFVEGSKQAVEVVSTRLSEADFEGLQGLVTPDAICELRTNISEFSLHQRLELALSTEDIYFCFPHQVGIMFNDKDQRRYVEITMCYHVLRGLKELREQSINPPIHMGVLPEYQDKLFICNYRFIREYTRGVEDQWTINVVNHFRPGETTS